VSLASSLCESPWIISATCFSIAPRKTVKSSPQRYLWPRAILLSVVLSPYLVMSNCKFEYLAYNLCQISADKNLGSSCVP
jgi:hypothetical protein